MGRDVGRTMFRLAGDMALALQWPAVVAAAAMGVSPGVSGGTLTMSQQAHLDALKERHAALEARILDEDQRPRPDTELLTRLKVEKLHVKEEMERLRTQAA
jgi:hypothetical protein